MADKRDTPRYRKRLTLKFGIQEPGQLAFTEDISLEGMFIKTASVYPPGSFIRVELSLPGDNSILFEGRVMWAKKVPPNMLRLARKCGMGVRITRIIKGDEEYRRLCEGFPITGSPPVQPTVAY